MTLAPGAVRAWKLPEQPALLTHTSMRPSCTDASSTSRCTLDGLATSHATPDTHTSELTCGQQPGSHTTAQGFCITEQPQTVNEELQPTAAGQTLWYLPCPACSAVVHVFQASGAGNITRELAPENILFLFACIS